MHSILIGKEMSLAVLFLFLIACTYPAISEYIKNIDELQLEDQVPISERDFSIDELEKGWYTYHKRKISWITYLTNNLYGILFFLSALILIYGFIKRSMKKRAYENYEDENNLWISL